MPWFVIERISNFEISKNFVADDAGQLCIVFCEICNFDDIIEECKHSVVDLLDEVYRFFDSVFKSHGVQKIEVYISDEDRRQDIYGLCWT
jgi:Adenylate and Guanylate cyclase catalytic domain